MTLESIYQQTSKQFVPTPEDNPNCLWFYAGWMGITEVCKTLGIEINSIFHQVHHALCTSHGDWDLFLEDLRFQAENITYPEKPRESFHHDYEPIFSDEDVLKRSKELFVSNFKVAFPGKRINSKFAQEKWNEVKEKAKEIATQELQEIWNSWKKREDKRQADLTEKIFRWEESFKQINQIKKVIQKITEEKK